MRRRLLSWVLTSLALALWTASAEASSFLLRVEGRDRGVLPTITTEDGAAYVSLDRLAHLLGVKPRWGSKTSQAIFTVGTRTVQLTRDRTRVLLAGKPVQLTAPPRVLEHGWVVPEEFLTKLLPRILPEVTVVKDPLAARPAVRLARQGVALEDLRFRSYPSFTRVVVEGSGRFDFVIRRSPKEIRVVLSGISIRDRRTEEVADGLIGQLRLEPSGRDVALTIDLETPPEELKTSTLEEPFRLVLDLYRRKGTRPDAGQTSGQPLRFIVLDAGHGGHDSGAIGPSGLQ